MRLHIAPLNPVTWAGDLTARLEIYVRHIHRTAPFLEIGGVANQTKLAGLLPIGLSLQPAIERLRYGERALIQHRTENLNLNCT